MSFRIAQVPIVRPWFKSAFLTSKCWRMDQNNPEAKGELVSDGGKRPKGLLPAYPTSLIVIKDLVISAGKASRFHNFSQSWSSSSSSGGGYLSLGPFHLGGWHGRSDRNGERASSAHFDSESRSMSVPGAQIIGFKCQLLPKSPDPLTSIKNWI
jgi:hypothetical protein